jgi:hypothetical protein
VSGHHFVSYSPADSRDFAATLSTDLERSQTTVRTWLDQRDLRSENDWAEETDEALRTCRSLIFVLSEDSARSNCRCAHEWRRAITYAKPITIVRISEGASCPFRLGNRKCIDFSGSTSVGLTVLIARLSSFDRPEGQLETLQEEVEDAKRDLDYAPEGQKQRVIAALSTLEQQIQNLKGAMIRAESTPERIARGIQRERQPHPAKDSNIQIRFVNPPPMVAPRYFQNRHVETKILGSFLRDPAACLLTISGRGGVGKTAFVCRALRHLEVGELPDEGGKLDVAGIIYMNAAGSREITFNNLFSDLLLLLDPGARNSLSSPCLKTLPYRNVWP